MRRLATVFARLVGLAVLIYGGFIFFGSLLDAFGDPDAFQPFWALYLILGLGFTGIGGSILYLLSFDGAPRHRTRGRRLLGWTGMMICASVPSSIFLLMAPLVLLALPTLLVSPEAPTPRRGRHLATSG